MTYEQIQQQANDDMLMVDKTINALSWLAARGMLASFTVIKDTDVFIYLKKKPNVNIEGTEVIKTSSSNAGRTVHCCAEVKGCSIHWEEKVQ